MQLRKLGWTDYLEILFGVVLPTAVFVPFASSWFYEFTKLIFSGDPRIAIVGLLPVLMCGIGLWALASLWMLLLFGASEIKRHLHLRWWVFNGGVLGIILASFFVYSTLEACLRLMKAGAWQPQMQDLMGILLIGPVILGF